MTYDAGDLARNIIYRNDVLKYLNNEKAIKLEIRLFEERNNVFFKNTVFDKMVEFIYQRVLELREIILNCLHDMTRYIFIFCRKVYAFFIFCRKVYAFFIFCRKVPNVNFSFRSFPPLSEPALWAHPKFEGPFNCFLGAPQLVLRPTNFLLTFPRERFVSLMPERENSPIPKF